MKWYVKTLGPRSFGHVSKKYLARDDEKPFFTISWVE
jgi:hypothetical protein